MQLAPEIYLRDLARLESTLLRSADGLVLIGRRMLRSNNSWMHNSLRLVKGTPPGWTLLIHPDDAAARGLSAGESARVTSRAGAVEAPVALSADMARGVRQPAAGWRHGRDGVSLRWPPAQPERA